MTTTLIEQEQAEANRLMVMVERLQQSGVSERQIAAAVGGARRRPGQRWSARLRGRRGARDLAAT